MWSPIEGLDRFEGTVLHSCQYQNPVPFLGQEVLVVGAGNSGCEIAVELARAGVTVSISVRGGAVFVPRTRSAIALQMGAFLIRNLPRPATNHLYEWFSTDFPELGLPQPLGHASSTTPWSVSSCPMRCVTGPSRRWARWTASTP